MKESIRIRDFLVIKRADIEVKRINIMIGHQARGKSVIAKLLYFFKRLSSEFIEGIRSKKSKSELDSDILMEFEKRFPRYSWEGTSFSIIYQSGSIEVTLAGTKTSRGKTKLSLKYSKELADIFISKKRTIAKKIDEAKKKQKTAEINPLLHETQILFEHLIVPLRAGEHAAFFSNSLFIPASRSFFANLQKNIFTFLASNIDIDPFLKEFGSSYENAKRWYKEDILIAKHKERGIFEDLYKVIELIINGDYEYRDEQDWIISKGKKINLVNASSGQQESLPMLLSLCVWPVLHFQEEGSMVFIEEPEAHLFPTSQGYIVSILSVLYRKMKSSFFITSHSPYILSAINNYIIAGDIESEEKLTLEEFKKINGTGMPIRFDDVSAYTIENGYATSIVNSEYRMIGGELLDSVSDHFQNVMNKLIVMGDQ